MRRRQRGKTTIQSIYGGTKAPFEEPAASKVWKNNIAGAFTFFIIINANATIYHDGAESSDESVNALFIAVNQSLDEIAEFGSMTNKISRDFTTP